MPRILLLLLALALTVAPHAFAQTPGGAPDTTTLAAAALQEPVEIIRDAWGINHIYAATEYDLFFAQGYAAARDRLFQFELWRRQATGTTAEMLGARAIRRDIGTRLFQFRGDLEQELNHYHPRGSVIIPAFVDGVNAYIAETEQNPALLPIEFDLLGIRPQRWTPAVVISRHQGLLMNVRDELAIGRAVHRLGAGTVRRLEDFHPGTPDLTLDPALDPSLWDADILGLYEAFRGPIRFEPDDIVAEYRGDEATYRRLGAAAEAAWHLARVEERESIGSNNWVVSGAKTESGYPMMANDPHRTQQAPSLRYWVHLVGPGWNVIGGGEPVLPGVSIGHNGHGAWGLTVFLTDNEDLYVYDTHPDDSNRYRYQGRWEPMRVIADTIQVKDAEPVIVDLKYTRHGPVVHEDERHDKAYAVRAGWMEIGGAPYLASLRMDQATTWEEFRDACSYSYIPGENMVWAGRDGTIGWQAVGIAPVRPNWSGLVPVPGDGRYEWGGYLPIRALPHVEDPAQGYWATANANLVPPDYPHRTAVGYQWSDPYRTDRLDEVLGSGRQLALLDMAQLQTDYLSIPARQLVPLLNPLAAPGERTEAARRQLLDWDYRLEPSSVPAGLYVAWERRLRANVSEILVPAAGQDLYDGWLPMRVVIRHLAVPDAAFGAEPVASRDALLVRSLDEAVRDLTEKLGRDMGGWHLGQPAYKHALLRHPLSPAVSADVRAQLEVGPHPRGGGSYTVNNTASGDNQTHGASFKIIVDTGDWDATLGMNTPGQSGDPRSPFYRNLFERWAKDQYVPIFYSRDKIDGVAREVVRLVPEE